MSSFQRMLAPHIPQKVPHEETTGNDPGEKVIKMKLGQEGVGGHMVETEERGGMVHPLLSTMFPLVHPSDPHKVAPGTNFSAMKYYP